MGISLLMVITAIAGILFSFARVQADSISPLFTHVALGIFLVSGTILIVAIANSLTVRAFEQSGRQVPSDLLRLLMSATLYAILGLIILKLVYEQDITTLLATSAIVSIMLGFGLREPIGHLFSGLTMEVERRLAVGDHIKCGDHRGQIEALRWRSVYLRTSQNSLVILPNSMLANNSVELYSPNELCLHNLELVIPSNIPPAAVLRAASEVMAAEIPYIEDPNASSVQMTGLDATAGSANYQVEYATREREFSKIEHINALVLERVWYALARNGIKLPGPYRQLHLAEISATHPGDEKAQAAQDKDRCALLSRIEAFRPVDADALTELTRSLAVIPYAAGEPIEAYRTRPTSFFIIHRGRIGVQCSGVKYLLKKQNAELYAGSFSSYADTSQWNRYVLQRMSEQLTYYLGPIAEHLVELEAKTTGDPYDLHHKLANYIEGEDERERFLRLSPKEQLLGMISGDVFGSFLFPEQLLDKSHIVALQETELLELTEETCKLLQESGGTLGDALAAFTRDTRNIGADSPDIPDFLV